LNHSKGIHGTSMTKREVVKQFVQSQDEDAQKRTLNLVIEL